MTIGTVWWLPWNGRLTANRVTIGSGDDQITARRVAALINPFRVSRDDVVISHVDIDAPHVGIDDLVVRDGEIAVRYPVGGATRTMAVFAIPKGSAPEHASENAGAEHIQLSVAIWPASRPSFRAVPARAACRCSSR